MNIEITPFVGVGPLRFGRSEAEITGSLGVPSRSVDAKEPMAMRRLDYPSKGVSCYLQNGGGLFLVVLTKSKDTYTFQGRDVFSAQTVSMLTAEGHLQVGKEDGFGVTASRAIGLGLEFCFEGVELVAIHCYERAAWKSYCSGEL